MIWGSNPRKGRNFSLLQIVQKYSGAPPAPYSMSIGVLFSGEGVGNRPERGVDHSSLSNTKVSNKWSSISTPLLWLHSVDRNKFLVHFIYLW
jgi:hypothetical protein